MTRRILRLIVVTLLFGCVPEGSRVEPPSTSGPSTSAAPRAPDSDSATPTAKGSGQRFFREITASSGIDYVHDTGATGRRYIPEIIAGGVAVIDFDGDGHFDLYFVDGRPLTAPGDPAESRLCGNRLYRNDGTGRFADVTEQAGVGDTAFGLGVAVGDVDNDGDSDLYVTNFGPNVLYRNRGDGTFESVPEAGGADAPGLSSSAAFVDGDRDGRLDLFVVTYLDFTLETHRVCSMGKHEVYCSPAAYPPAADHFYAGNGDATFRDLSGSIDLGGAPAGKGLGVVAGDFDDDGFVDLYVANDGTANQLLLNQPRDNGRRWLDDALLLGLAYGESAKAEAGMGVFLGFVDADGYLDVTVTNLEAQTTSLYLNDGGLGALESSYPLGVGAPSLPYVGFGARFLDVDLDGALDLFVTNGHILDNATQVRPGSTFEQPDQLFRQVDGKFVEVLAQAKTPNLPLRAGRGLASVDLDGDGDLDLIVANNGATPTVLENVATKQGGSVGLFLEGAPPGSNRDAYGARVTGKIEGRQLIREVGTSGSYLAAHDPRLLISTGRSSSVALTIRWPSGAEETIEVKPGSYWKIREGEGVVGETPFRR
ncbi:MAG: CRTAC1 family protein [Planctomycetota bacterium]